jgi:hypothetical protein
MIRLTRGYHIPKKGKIPAAKAEIVRGQNEGFYQNSGLVGGFKHVLFSIIYGVILPID